MRLFRRTPGGRAPDAPEAPPAPERVRAVQNRDDEETIAELLTLFRETPPSEQDDAPDASADEDDLPDMTSLAEGLGDDPDDLAEAPFATPSAALPGALSGAASPGADFPHAPAVPDAPTAPTEARGLRAPADAAPVDVTAIARAAGRPGPEAVATSAPAPTPAPTPTATATPAPAHADPDTAGRASRRAGRVKTRFLGFEHSHATSDPFSAAWAATPPAAEASPRFPVGWIVVVKGPGRGASFTLTSGVSLIGRGEDQAVRLDFGDTSISRQGHAVVAYDPEQRKHFIGHGGKVNIVRLNDMPVLSTEELNHGDRIRVGETTLAFIALCGEGFDWQEADGSDADLTAY